MRVLRSARTTAMCLRAWLNVTGEQHRSLDSIPDRKDTAPAAGGTGRGRRGVRRAAPRNLPHPSTAA